MELINSIQRGSTILNSAGSVTDVSISAVTTSRSWLICTLRNGDNAPKTFMLSYFFNDASTVRMQVNDKTTPNTVVDWQVIEFTVESGITVQHLTSTTQTSLTISSVTVSASHAQVNWNHTGFTYGDDDGVRCKITGPTTLTIVAPTSDTKFCQVLNWGSHARVQHVDISVLTSDTTTKDVTINTLTDYTRTMVIGSSETVTKTGTSMFMLYCTSNNNLRVERMGGNVAQTITAQVIEFVNPSISVQQFLVTFSSGDTSKPVSINNVNIQKVALVPCSSEYWFAATDKTDDDFGYFGVTYTLTNSTTVTLQRTDTGNITKAVFSLIEFDVFLANIFFQMFD